MSTEYQRISQELAAIRRKGDFQEVFGASAHGFACHPPLSEPELADFETRYAVRLPADYRTFLMQVGNGGAGPAYGVFRLGEMDEGLERVSFYPWYRHWLDGVLDELGSGSGGRTS